ncbi:MAG: HAD-IA family hydrolase [Gaiellaceae bacterium]
MRSETVLFDLDGTLIDSGAAILASFRHATRTVLGRDYADHVLMAGVGGHGLHRQMADLDPERVDDLVQAYRDHNLDSYRTIRVFPGVDAVLAHLREDERTLGMVTVKSRATVELTFEIAQLGSYFETVVTGDDVERHKPEPDALVLAAGRLGADPSSTAYVGDSPFDIQAAKEAGMRAVAVSWGGIHPRARLAQHRPDAIVDVPGELLRAL